jgi:hypothetical protein
MTDMPATSSIEATSGAAQTPFKDWYLAGGGPVYSITFADGSVWRADTGWQVWRETKRSPASGPSHEPKSNKGLY